MNPETPETPETPKSGFLSTWPSSAKVVTAVLILVIIILIITRAIYYFNEPCANEYYDGRGPSCKRMESTLAMLKLQKTIMDPSITTDKKIETAGYVLVTYPDLISQLLEKQMKDNPSQFEELKKMAGQ